MANCQVQYNNDGSIKTVLDKSGNESKLFLSIAKLPMVNSLEEALDIYRETYAKGIADTSEIVITSGFESNLRTALSNIKDKNPKNVKGWINQLNDTEKTGVRYTNQEIEWIGLEDYLKEYVKENKPKNGNIPFNIIDQYVQDNQIEVSEVVKRGPTEEDIDIFLEDEAGEGFTREEAREYLRNEERDDTKYSQYTLEGGQSYREVLLTLPIRKLRIEEVVVGKDEYTVRDSEVVEGRKEVVHKGHILDEIDPLDGESPKANYTYYTNGQGGFSQSKGELEANQEDYSQDTYVSTHWDEANVLAHIRMNERTLPNGERILFIEELQADAPQEARKKGYQERYIKDRLVASDTSNRTKDDINRFHLIDYLDENGNIEQSFQILKSKYATLEEAIDYIAKDKIKNEGGVPNFTPYKKTDQWVGMSMRRVMQMAAQEGFDRVAWVTGEQSAERYDLSKQIDEIRYIKYKEGYELTVTDIEGTNRIEEQIFKENELEDVVGKEIAEKIIKGEGVKGKYEGFKGETTLENIDLKVGGEGMKAFYNQIVPKVALKEAQRFDKKAKVEVVELSVGKGSWMIDITKEQLENRGTKITEQEAKDYKFKDGEFIATIDSRGNVYRLYDTQDIKDADYNNIYTAPNLNFSKQLSIKLTPRAKATLLGAVPLFQKNSSSEKVQRPKDVIDFVVEILKKTVLAKNATVLDNQGIVDKLIELGVPSETAYQVIAYHGRTRPINNFEREGKKRNKFGEILSGVYFGEPYIAAAFAGVDNFSGNDNANVAKVSLDDSSFYTVDMKGTTPSGDVSLINTIGQKEWDKIKALKDSGQIKGLKLLNTREFLVGEEGPTTQYVVYNTEVIDMLKEYKGAEVNRFVPRLDDFLFQKGINVTPQGFVYNGEVYINKDGVDPVNTAIHEFGHLWNSWAQKNIPQVYQKGIDLIKEQGQEYIDFVKKNQPNLSGEALYEEALAQAIGDNGAKIVEASRKESIVGWLKSLWDSIKNSLGISKVADISNMTLDEFASAVATDLLSGQPLTTEEISQSKGVQLKYNKEGKHLAPNGKPSNLTEEQAKIVRTKAFKDWFGDWENDSENASKAVDKNGEPFVFYHGSPHIKSIDIFNNERSTFFFSTDISEAYRYTTKGFAKDEIGRFFINTKNILDIRDLFKEYTNTKPYGEKLERFLIENSEAIIKEANDIFFLEKEMDDLEEKEYLLDYYEDDASNKWDNLSDFEKIDLLLRKGSNDWKILETNTFLNFIKENYDGFVTNEGDFNLAVFNPNQIKSATENQGTFSSENNDIRFSILSDYRDNTRFKYSDLIYPDVVFKDINTSAETKVATDFYKKIISKFNSLFDRDLKLETSTTKNDFTVTVEYETGLRPKYFAYPTETMGEHVVVDNIDKNVPLTSLRHELIHEMLVKNITDKFERINNLDNSANSDSIEEVQRNRAYNYTLEDVFFERVVENVERNPDNKDTFEMSTFGVDVVNRVVKELGGKEFSKDNVLPILNELLEDSNQWLTDNLIDIFSNKVDYSKDTSEIGLSAGEIFGQRFKLSKNVLPKELQSKIFEFTEFFNEEYTGVLTRLNKIDKRDKVNKKVAPGNRLFNTPLEDASTIADSYMSKTGIQSAPIEKITSINKDRAKRIADEFDKMEASPDNSETKRAYQAMIDETISQYEEIISNGYKVEINNSEPYSSAQDMIDDLRNNKRMKIFSTESGFGDEAISDKQRKDNPLLQGTRFKDINGVPLLANDLFRFVHDFFGHAKFGNGFGAIGEENAWNVHSKMYSPLARRAMTTETRGQNSWVNFSGVNDKAFEVRNKARKLRAEGKFDEAQLLTEQVYDMMSFAEQKVGLLPHWVSETELFNIKSLPFEEEGGATLNMDNSTVTEGIAVPVMSRNITQETLTEEVFEEFKSEVAAFGEEFKVGVYKFPNSNKVSLDAVYISNDESKSLALAKKLGQESIFNITTGENIKTGESGDNPRAATQSEIDELKGLTNQVIEPELSFKDAESYSDALNKEQDIEIGIETTDGFKTLLTIPYNVNPETRDGFINKYIKEGLLNEQKTLYKGKQYFTIKGTNAMDKKSKELILADDLTAMLGADSHTIKEGMIDVKEEDSYKYNTQEINIINDLASELIRANKVKLANSRPKKLSEKELKLKLMTLLNKLGIETLSIADYVEKYKVKSGVDPSVRALADSANRVVAFKDGIITLEDLTEEVMHIIVESLPSEQVENILRNIHRTTEYAQDSQRYREAYTKAYPKMSKEQIEQLVRKEILGKVLKNSTLENVESNNFYDKAADFISSFFNRISENKELRDQLKNINGLIEQLFIQENLEDYLDGKIDIESVPMYSLGNATSGDTTLDLARSLQKAVLNALKQSYASIDKGSGTLYADKIKMQRYGELINTVSQATSASDFLGVINRQVQFVQNGINEAKAKDTALPIEIRQVIVSLNDSLRKLLERQKDVTLRLTPKQLGLVGENETVSSEEAELRKRTLVNKIDETVSSIGWVTGQAANIEDTTFNDIIDRIKIRQNLSDSQSEFLRSQAEMMNKEIGFFMETFGQLTQSSDGLLNVAANVVEEMWGKHASLTQKTFRKFTKVMEENNIDPKQLTELFRDGFLLNPYNFDEFNREVLNKDVEVYNEIFSENISVEEYQEAKKSDTLKKYDAKQQLTASRLKNEKMSDIVERRMNDEYYRKQAEKYEKLGISKYTIDQLKALSLQRAIIQNDATDADGKVIYTEYNKDALDSLSQMRKEYKATVNSLGTLKQGYNEMTKEEATAKGIDIFSPSNEFIEIGNLIYTLDSDASDEARLSFELHLIDNNFEKTERRTNTQALIEKFVDISNDLGMEKGIEFLENNLGLSFSTDFWDSISTENILDNVDVNLIEGNPETIKRIRQKRNRLSQLKKLYQDPMNPQEVKGYEMKPSEQEVIKNLVEEIDLEMKNLVIPESVERTQEFSSEVSVNQSYKDALSKEVKEELSKEEFNFIRKHVTSANESYLVGLESKAKALDEGRGNVSERTKEKLEQYMEDGDTYYQAFVRLARTRVLPYYKRFTPEGYKTISDITSELTSDEIKQGKIVEYISQLENDPNYELNIHYTFNSEAQDINPNWDKDFKGGYYQPKLSKFLDKKFVEMFDPEVVDGKFTGTVRKNQNLYNVQQALVELQSTNLEFIGHEGSTNVYKLPQISRTRTNQVIDLLNKPNKGRTFKEILKDTFNYRIDDLEYGDKENEVDIQKATDSRTVPTFYTRDLENKEDLSDDLFYTYMAMTNQSALHKVRRDGLTDILAVEDKMINRSTANGKNAQATRNYKMLKSYIDFNYYGMHETRAYKVKLPIIDKEIDLTKVLRQINSYVKLRNLGLNVIVPFTSYITGEVNLQIEATLGEYFSRDSLRLASKEFSKLFKETGFVQNSLSYNDKSKLNVLGEYLGGYNQSEKAGNAKYPTMMRWLAKLGMVLHQVGNLPIIPRIYLSILFDHRVINGAIVSKKQFDAGYTDKKQAESEWKSYENNSLYHYLDVKDTGVEIKPKLLEELNGDQEYLDNKIQKVKSLIKDQVQKIDGQIPESQRVNAQRDAVFNYFMTHRGWFAIAAQRRLKGLQLNLETGQMEEGTYITLKNLIFDMFGEVGSGNDKTWNFVKAFKKAYEGSRNNRDAELVARNMKRVGVEFAFMTGIVMVLAAVTAMADDDDNKDLYALQLTNYFLWRLANETSSTQLGLFTEASNIIKTPVVGYQQVIDMTKIGQIFDTDELKSGTYKGHTGTYKYFFKNTVGLKGLHDLMNVRTTEDTYEYYNRSNLEFSSMGLFSLLNSEE